LSGQAGWSSQNVHDTDTKADNGGRYMLFMKTGVYNIIEYTEKNYKEGVIDTGNVCMCAKYRPVVMEQ